MVEYPQKFRTNHTTTNGLSSNDVRSIVVDGQNGIWAGTSKGLSQFDGAKWTPVAEIADISILYLDGNQDLWTVAGRRLFDHNYQIAFEIPEIIRTITEDNRRQVWIAGSNEIYYSTLDGAWHHLDKEPIGCNIQGMAIDNDGRIWLATDNGLISYCDGEEVLFNRQNSGLPSNNLRCIEIDRYGHLWIGSDAGGTVFDRQTEWYLINGSRSGLPYEDVVQIRLGPNGQRWIGTTLGAILWDNGKWEYFHSKRWLPDDYVNAISIQDDGTAFIATSEGISQIEKRAYTLEQKAETFEKTILARHDRRGYVTSCN
ncbi:MAG: two-component regulator propeller domain-containing protein, partial [Candidatus Poribacteria bacterium]|nr:two-component regulator propeller domain-containing protein [Candidatus Poribacteria bacterium]